MAFTKKLNEEDKRGIAGNLTEEELALFDLLTKPDVRLTKQEEIEVKKAAKALLEVRYTIETVLDQLPRVYSKEMYQQKRDTLYRHFYDAYTGQGHSVYTVNRP